MKLVDEKGKIFGLINIVDLAVLLVLVLLIGAFGYKILRPDNDNTNQTALKTYLISVKCPLSPEAAADSIKIGNMIYLDSTGSLDNTSVISVEETPAEVEVVTADGQLKITEHPTLKDVYIDFEFRTDTDGALKLGGIYQLNVGKDFVFKTTRVELDGIITNITEQ